jgi:hypothetical protein
MGGTLSCLYVHWNPHPATHCSYCAYLLGISTDNHKPYHRSDHGKPTANCTPVLPMLLKQSMPFTTTLSRGCNWPSLGSPMMSVPGCTNQEQQRFCATATTASNYHAP